MTSATKAIVLVVIVALLGVGGYALFHKSSYNTTSPTTNSSGQSPAASSSTDTAPVAATITFTDSGFSPALVTVKSGDTIRITNKSSQPIQVDSNPHPAHTDDTELNVGAVDAGASKTFVLTTKGTWGYHDHLSPGFTGRINVE
jgi:plastocyanin